MQKFYKRRSVQILMVVTGILVLLLLYTIFSGSVLFSNLLGAVTPMQKVSAEAAQGTAGAISDAAKSREELLEENQALQAEIDRLNEALSDYYDYKQENAQLRNYLGLKQDNPDYQFVYGSVVARDTADPFYGFRVDQGSLAGVSVHDPVITENGLVGWVSSVSGMYCQVTTIFSPECSISAMDKVNRDTGILASDIRLSDEGLVRLSYLEADHTVQKGDMIVTSGVGGFFPKNLRIGKAVEVRSNETDVSLYATVKPYVDIKNVRDVLIITDFQGKGEALAAAQEEKS